MKRKVQTVAVAILPLILLAGCGDTGEPQTEGPDGTTEGPGEAPTSTQEAPTSIQLAGNAEPGLPDGEPGEVSIVAHGPFRTGGGRGSGSVGFVAQNRTTEVVRRIEVTGAALDDGATVGSGRSQNVYPHVVEPGGIAFGFVFFDGGVPEGAQFEFNVDYRTADSQFLRALDVEVTEANKSGDQIVGTVSNQLEEPVDGPIGVGAACFDDDDLLGVASGFTERDTLPPGEGSPYSVELLDLPCPTFLVGASGYETL